MAAFAPTTAGMSSGCRATIIASPLDRLSRIEPRSTDFGLTPAR